MKRLIDIVSNAPSETILEWLGITILVVLVIYVVMFGGLYYKR